MPHSHLNSETFKWPVSPTKLRLGMWPMLIGICCSLRASQVDVSTLPSAHLVVAGACCQPFSHQGTQGSWADGRSETMLAALDLVCDQATRPSSCLIGFALENVKGLLDKGSRESSPHD